MYAIVHPRYYNTRPLSRNFGFDNFFNDWFHLPLDDEVHCGRHSQGKEWTHKLDLSGYQLEDISICNEEGKIIVKARHQEGEDYMELSRSVAIPDDVDKEKVQCNITPDHQLLIHGPRKVVSKKRKSMDPLSQLFCNSQVVKKDDGKEVYQMDIPCKDFKPEELKMHQDGNRIVIEGKHQNEGEYKHYRREFTLPTGAKMDNVSCTMDDKGTLRLETPYHHLAKPVPKEINIGKSTEEHHIVQNKETGQESMEQ